MSASTTDASSKTNSTNRTPSHHGLAALRRFTSTLTTMLLTRAQLALVELSQARQQLVASLAWLVVAAVLLLLTLLALSAWVVLVLWPLLGANSLLLLTVIYSGVTAFAYWQWRLGWQAATPLLQLTLDELQQDRDALAAVFYEQGGDSETSSQNPHRQTSL